MWTDGKLVSFDTETDSPNPEVAHIVTASIVVIDGATGEIDANEWLVAVEHDIAPEASAIHGISTEYAREHGRPAREVVGEVADVIEEHCVDQRLPLIVYNSSFDCTLLDRELRRHFGSGAGFDAGRVSVIDPLVLDRALDRYRKGKRTLSAVSAHYGVPISEADAHGSTADALCAARVAWKIGKRFPRETADLVALQEFQRRNHEAWAIHLGEYLRSQGKPDDVGREWPYRPYVAEAVAS